MRKFLDTSRIRRESRESRFNREIRRKSIFFRKDGIWENFDFKILQEKALIGNNSGAGKLPRIWEPVKASRKSRESQKPNEGSREMKRKNREKLFARCANFQMGYCAARCTGFTEQCFQRKTHQRRQKSEHIVNASKHDLTSLILWERPVSGSTKLPKPFL